jgi:hypothetical protein
MSRQPIVGIATVASDQGTVSFPQNQSADSVHRDEHAEIAVHIATLVITLASLFTPGRKPR